MNETGQSVVQDPSVAWIAQRWRPAAELRPAPGRPAFAFLGVPFDHAVSHRPGTRFGPRAILAALDGYTLYCTDKRVSLEQADLHRLGEVDVVHSLEESYRRIEAAVGAIHPGAVPIILGGDHSISDPAVRGMQRRLAGKRFGLIVFDAHFDSRPPVPGKEHSGHWMRTLEGVFDHRRSVQLGIDAPIYGPSYMDRAERSGILVRTAYEIRKRGWGETIREAVAHAAAGADGVYISVDIDVLDQAFAPGTSVPNPGGLHPHEVMDAIYEICLAAPAVGLDVTEVSPPLDPSGRTSEVAAHLVLNFMAGVTRRLQGRG